MQTKRRTGMFALNAYWFALSCMWNSLGPIILPALVALLVPENVKGSALGLLSAVGLVVAIIVQPVAGAISDRSASRWGRRRPFILGGTLVDLVFLAGIALAPQYWVLFVAYLGLQLASNVAHGPYQGLIPDLVAAEERGKASGVKQLAEILGIVGSSLVAGYLMSRGQRLLAIGGIAAILLVTLAITLFGVQEEPQAEASSTPLLRTVLETFDVDIRRYADYMWLLVSRLLVLVGMNLVRNYALYYVQDRLAMTVEEATAATGTLMAILAVAIAVVVYPAGVLSDRFGRKPLLVISGVAGAAGSLLMLLGTTYAQLIAFGGLLGLTIGIYLSVNWALATDLIPEEEAGRYLGISNLATAGAGVVAGVGGPLLDYFNAQVPFRGYMVVFGLAAACYLLGTALLAKVREEQPALQAAPTADG